ncbi:hypothetical protein BHM03_00049654 [Ensete ventricosum]|nr:hypothetical protein BHM03_00049654 [Ensete ventricosum]
MSYLKARFAISTCTARYGWYIPVRQVVGTRTVRYWAVPPKIDRQRLIEEEIDHRRSIDREKGKKKKKRKRRKKEKRRRRKNTYHPLVVFARARAPSSLARYRERFFSRTGRKIEATQRKSTIDDENRPSMADLSATAR